MPFTKILVAYDGSKAANKALETALSLTEQNASAKIDVLHVFHTPNYAFDPYFVIPASAMDEYYEAHTTQINNEVQKYIANRPEASLHLMKGVASEAILSYADDIGADLIIIGSRGLRTIGELVLGSVSHHVTQHAKVPVLVIK